MKKVALSIMLLMTFELFGQKVNTIDLKSFFQGHSGGFAVYNLKTGEWFRFNPEQCRKRLSPCSTFKIPNSLIGLETGIIKDTGYVIKYDSVLHPENAESMDKEPFKFWYQDLSLARAFKYSCVWYYQELARRVGKERMEKYVNLINYGNNDISSGIDTFWLCGSIQISINEQIEFLRRLYLNKINGFSEKTINEVKSIMLYESNPNYRLYGKTGTGPGGCLDNKVLGWYVGFVETESGVSLFAMNIAVNTMDDLKNNLRIEITKKTLQIGNNKRHITSWKPMEAEMELTALELEKVNKFVKNYKNKKETRSSFQPLVISMVGVIVFIVSIIYTFYNPNLKTIDWLFLPASAISMLFIVGGIFIMNSNKKESEIISIAKIIENKLK